ncbi:MAG: beta-ketoacyl-ACP synthase II [Ardenticatenaceae bacterium]|nr:beta-ketoacyl-ACP synthase II [Ardenticatenaceae bacterium]
MNYLNHRNEPRVVITGMGMITPVGNTVKESWEGVLTGRSGIDVISRFDPEGLPCRIAGEVRGFDPADFMPAKEARRMARCSQFSVAAAREALDDAGFPDTVPEPERSGVVFGTGMGGFDFADHHLQIYRNKGFSRVSPFSLISSLGNMPSYHISVLAQTKGPISTVVAACATGVQAIGEAAEQIRRGRADLMLAGGVEGIIHEAALAGFAAIRALCVTHNEDPQSASRPFNIDRNGFILSEGAGVLVLERLDHALARGARIYAEVAGHASSSDAYHITAIDPDAKGAVRAMSWALADGDIKTDQIDYINAHGTSTPINDAAETIAIKKLFGEHAYDLAVSSTKSVTGHAMGGAGAIEAIFTAKALETGVLPPTWNYENPDPECDLDYVPNAPRTKQMSYALSNSFGLGGQNACLVLGRMNGHL